MRRKIIALFLIMLLLTGIAYRNRQINRINGAQPPRIMAGDTCYSYSRDTAAPPDTPQDGTITRIIAPHEVPSQNGEANFSRVGAPYWIIPGGVVVENNGKYVILI